jgi:hypothetical protein
MRPERQIDLWGRWRCFPLFCTGQVLEVVYNLSKGLPYPHNKPYWVVEDAEVLSYNPRTKRYTILCFDQEKEKEITEKQLEGLIERAKEKARKVQEYQEKIRKEHSVKSILKQR